MSHPIPISDESVILVVDDEPDIRDLMKEILAPVSNHIVVAADGVEALALMKTHNVGCILSDFQMPRMNGLELLEHLTAEGSLIPFVMLTAHGDQEKLCRALRLGALDFISKPFDLTVVREVITRALEIGKRKRLYQEQVNKLCLTNGGTSEELHRLERDRKMLGLLQVVNSGKRKA